MLRSLLIGVALASSTPLAAAPAERAPRPNIVLIVSDDQAWTDYSFIGHPHIQTPNIDRLSSESLTFPRGYVPSSLCCPSLASLLTGRYPHQHKITSNDPPIPPGISARDFQRSAAFQQGREVMNRHMESVPTLPRLLRTLGYNSLQTGKWWQGHFARGGFSHGMTQGGRHGDQGLDIGRKTMQPIYDFIDASCNERVPFLVWYAPMMPHDPHTPPERLLNKYREKTSSLHVARYWAMIEWFDETVGELLGEIDRRGLKDNTIVVYVADNGWIQDPEQPRYAARSKQSPYDGGLRTPIMIRWPATVRAEVAHELASSIDIVPTVLAALGEPPPQGLPGINLLDRDAARARSAIYGECFTHNAIDLDRPAANLRWRWMIEGTDKLIVPHPKNEPNATVQLFDLHTDPSENSNLASAQPRRVAELRAKLDRWWPGE
jgi:uncharacterized sulfatase